MRLAISCGMVFVVLIGLAFAQVPTSPDPQVLAEARLALDRGHANAAAGKYTDARAEFARVTSMAGLPAHYKSLAQLQVARCFVRENKPADAKLAYREVSAIVNVPPHHALEAEEAVKAIERTEAGMPPRDQGIQGTTGNAITSEDPGFVDAAGGNFALKDDALVLKTIGFSQIPFREIGLYEDSLRAALDATKTP